MFMTILTYILTAIVAALAVDGFFVVLMCVVAACTGTTVSIEPVCNIKRTFIMFLGALIVILIAALVKNS